jgi:hypothetical protein
LDDASTYGHWFAKAAPADSNLHQTDRIADLLAFASREYHRNDDDK